MMSATESAFCSKTFQIFFQFSKWGQMLLVISLLTYSA